MVDCVIHRINGYKRIESMKTAEQELSFASLAEALTAAKRWETLVVCGGGGIPVTLDENGDLQGLRAVVDKDLASALLALDVGADAMMILTNIDRVRINFGKPDERAVEQMTLSEAKTWYDEGQFPPGSMGPKILGAIKFLSACKSKDATVVIAALDAATDAMAGKAGTRITVG